MSLNNYKFDCFAISFWERKFSFTQNSIFKLHFPLEYTAAIYMVAVHNNI